MIPLIPVPWLVSGVFTVATAAVSYFNKQKTYGHTDETNNINERTNGINEQANKNKMKSFAWIGATILLGLFFWW